MNNIEMEDDVDDNTDDKTEEHETEAAIRLLAGDAYSSPNSGIDFSIIAHRLTSWFYHHQSLDMIHATTIDPYLVNNMTPPPLSSLQQQHTSRNDMNDIDLDLFVGPEHDDAPNAKSRRTITNTTRTTPIRSNKPAPLLHRQRSRNHDPGASVPLLHDDGFASTGLKSTEYTAAHIIDGSLGQRQLSRPFVKMSSHSDVIVPPVHESTRHKSLDKPIDRMDDSGVYKDDANDTIDHNANWLGAKYTDDDGVVGDSSATITTEVCGICLETIEADMWACPLMHAFCATCLISYLEVQLQQQRQHAVISIVCPEHRCTQEVPTSVLHMLLSDSQVAAINRSAVLAREKNIRECPRCFTVVPRVDAAHQLECPQCSTIFCYVHGLEHDERTCRGVLPSPWQRIKTTCWTLMNTRTCPKCRRQLQKNGGCDHVTCLCGHEICWKCGGNWVWPDGVRGHSYETFPSAANIKYSCRSASLWVRRVSASVALAPVAAVMYPSRAIARTLNQAIRPGTKSEVQVNAVDDDLPAMQDIFNGHYDVLQEGPDFTVPYLITRQGILMTGTRPGMQYRESFASAAHHNKDLLW